MKAFLPILAALWGPVAWTAPAVSSGKTAGAAIASIVVEVYSDFQCPACKSLHEQTIVPLNDEYVRSGKVYLVHHDFPLPMHPYARQAASWATAAARVGRYKEVSDALFRKQAAWGATGKIEEALAGTVSAAELAKIRALVSDPKVAAEIDSDVRAAQAANIRQTPTIIVTHRLKQYPLSGYVNWQLLRRFIDELAKK